MSALPAPLVPANVDLRDFAFMPLEFRRLFTSETWLLGSDAAKLAALALWCESWHQVPAASLPDNDKVLASLSQAGSRWARLRSHALRGWVKCADGRLYHPVVAGKALDAWEKKQEQRLRTLKARIAALEKRLKDAVTDDERAHLQTVLLSLRQGLSQNPVTGSKGQLKGEGQLKGKGNSATDPSLRSESSAPKTVSAGGAKRRPPDPAKTGATWEAYSLAYRKRYGVEPTRNATVNGQMSQFVARVPLEEAPHIAAFYVSHSKAYYVGKSHSVGLLLADAEALRTQWLGGQKVTETEARQADRTQATGNAFSELIAEAEERERHGTH